MHSMHTRVAEPRHSPAVAGHLADLRDEGKLDLFSEPRCRVCRDPELCRLVNDLISHGHTHASILQILEPVNATRPAKARITSDSLWKHGKKHFNMRAPAREVYRRILERRAAESDADYENGIATLVSAIGYLDVMMHRGYETLVAEDTVISPQQGAWAAKQLHELTKQDAGVERMSQLHAQLNRIVAVMREVVPPEFHQAILDKLEGKETTPTPINAEPVRDEQIEEFDPADDEDFEQEDWENG